MCHILWKAKTDIKYWDVITKTSAKYFCRFSMYKNYGNTWHHTSMSTAIATTELDVGTIYVFVALLYTNTSWVGWNHWTFSIFWKSKDYNNNYNTSVSGTLLPLRFYVLNYSGTDIVIVQTSNAWDIDICNWNIIGQL